MSSTVETIFITPCMVNSCQDRFSQLETDTDGGAKVLGKRVGSGSYYSRVVRAEAKRVRVEE